MFKTITRNNIPVNLMTDEPVAKRDWIVQSSSEINSPNFKFFVIGEFDNRKEMSDRFEYVCEAFWDKWRMDKHFKRRLENADFFYPAHTYSVDSKYLVSVGSGNFV